MYKPIAIIGAGLTGLMCALHLVQRGFEIAIYERRSSEELCQHKYKISGQPGRSMSMDISARGIYALEQIGALPLVQQEAVPMRFKITHDINGQQSSLPYGRHDDECILTISRTSLYQILFNRCATFDNISFHFDHRLLSINFSEKTAEMRDEKGALTKIINPHVIIGADGVNSTTREIAEAQFGKVFEISFFPMYYKELSIPSQKKISLNAMHTWPRRNMMLVAQPNSDASFTCALLMHEKSEQPSFANITSPQQIRALFDHDLFDASECMPNLESEYMTNPIGKLKMVSGASWGFGDFALLLGDAAHAMVPFFGQGVNCCFEDCSFLSEQLDLTDNNWSEVMRRFNAQRTREANAINRMSYENYPELFTNPDLLRIQLHRQIEAMLSKKYSDRFRTYHNLVCFDRVPYTLAQRIKSIQISVLERLGQGINNVDDIDPENIKKEIDVYQRSLDILNKDEIS